MLLAEVASEKLLHAAEQSPPKLSHNYRAKSRHRTRNKVEPYKVKQCSKEDMASKRYWKYIDDNVHRLTEHKGVYRERLDILKQEVVYGLKIWPSLTPEQQGNLQKNTRYIINRCNRRVKVAGTLPFMQVQGKTN